MDNVHDSQDMKTIVLCPVACHRLSSPADFFEAMNWHVKAKPAPTSFDPSASRIGCKVEEVLGTGCKVLRVLCIVLRISLEMPGSIQ